MADKKSKGETHGGKGAVAAGGKSGGAKAARSQPAAKAEAKAEAAPDPEVAKARLAKTGRNDMCPCGSGQKYKKCHLRGDEAAAVPPAAPPDPQELLQNGWRLFEQRRPGAAEKEFRAALAIDASLADAQVGIGMARLAASDPDGAKQVLGQAVVSGETLAADLRARKATDGFEKPEAQAYIRACHALGCLAYDQNRFDDALVDLERVYTIDGGPVGTEARLIAGKTLCKLGRGAEAVAVLEPATKSESHASRAHMGLALAHFTAGDQAAAGASVAKALVDNPHLGKALLGKVRRNVENLAGAAPGSVDEAVVYNQTYGDVWTPEAKAFLEGVLGGPSAPGGHRASTPAADAGVE